MPCDVRDRPDVLRQLRRGPSGALWASAPDGAAPLDPIVEIGVIAGLTTPQATEEVVRVDHQGRPGIVVPGAEVEEYETV